MVPAILGGEALPSALDAVVAVLGGDDAVLCSGVVLGSRHVLTAAHCAGGEAVAWGTDLVDGVAVEVSEVAAVTVAEGWTEGDHDRDLAVLELDDEAPVDPWPLAEAAPGPGDPLWIYGFGVTSEVGDTSGRKRGAVLEVLEVGEGTLLSWNPAANACSGDSGGPAIARGADGWAVVGVQTWVDPACLGGKAGTTRADARGAWLEGLIPDLARGGVPDAVPGVEVEPRGCAHAPGGLGWVAAVLVGAKVRRKSRTPHGKPQN